MSILHDVMNVDVLDGYRLRLRFEDGAEGDVDVTDLVPFEGVFAPLRDGAAYTSVRVDPDLGTIVWPNGADLDPAVLYPKVTGAPLPGAERLRHAG